jgi:hypothetical protein
MDGQDLRVMAWYDTLARDERAEAEYILQNLRGDWAAAYLGVKLLRLEKKGGFRLGLREIVSTALAVGAALGFTHGTSLSDHIK